MNFLAGATASDPATLAGILIVALATGTAASLLPANRASGIDPGTALRRE